MHLAALSQSVAGISCQKPRLSWFQFKWSFWTCDSHVSPPLSLSRFLTSFAKHPLALYMLCLVYMLVCIFVYQPGTIVAREIDEAVLIGAFGFHLIVARLEWNFNRLNDRSRHRSDDDLFKRMSDDLKRRWNRRFQWKTKKRQVFD